MSLRNEIETKLQSAIKKRNKLQISTLRLILAAIKDRDIATRTNDNREGIKDEDIKHLLKVKYQKPLLSLKWITYTLSIIKHQSLRFLAFFI